MICILIGTKTYHTFGVIDLLHIGLLLSTPTTSQVPSDQHHTKFA